MSDSEQPDYTVTYGWNSRLVTAIETLAALIRPMPGWLRVTAARDLLTRTTLRATAEGITGSSSGAGTYPWNSITHIVIWRHRGLRIVGVVRRDDGDQADVPWGTAVWGNSMWRRLQNRGPRDRHDRYDPDKRTKRDQSKRQAVGVRQSSTIARHLQIMAPDGMPFGTENLLTTDGWAVDARRLNWTARRFAPQVTVVNLTHHAWVPHTADDDPISVVGEFLEAIHLPWRRLLWTLGVAFSTWGVVDDSRKLDSGLLPARAVGGHVLGLALASIALLALLVRWGFLLRRRWRGRRSGGPAALVRLTEDPPDYD